MTIILLSGFVFYLIQKNNAVDDCYNFESCGPTYESVSNPDYIFNSGYTSPGTGGYACSKPIKLVSNLVDEDGVYVNHKPVDEAEAKLYCHMTSAEEYKGKLKVLQKPEVLELIGKYQYKDVSIKALEFKYIQDKDFVHRLLPAYKEVEIGCIILLDTPDEDKIYLEDEDLETFEELDYQTFKLNLEQISAADRQLFYDNLK